MLGMPWGDGVDVTTPAYQGGYDLPAPDSWGSTSSPGNDTSTSWTDNLPAVSGLIKTIGGILPSLISAGKGQPYGYGPYGPQGGYGGYGGAYGGVSGAGIFGGISSTTLILLVGAALLFISGRK